MNFYSPWPCLPNSDARITDLLSDRRCTPDIYVHELSGSSLSAQQLRVASQGRQGKRVPV
ncbi:hypothetical protein BCAR13_440015 [Paraburkholderia caribensis]|nr:hypothetical protein BCAR13_440015 [Paraburkholderia caribensis]